MEEYYNDDAYHFCFIFFLFYFVYFCYLLLLSSVIH